MRVDRRALAVLADIPSTQHCVTCQRAELDTQINSILNLHCHTELLNVFTTHRNSHFWLAFGLPWREQPIASRERGSQQTKNTIHYLTRNILPTGRHEFYAPFSPPAASPAQTPPTSALSHLPGFKGSSQQSTTRCCAGGEVGTTPPRHPAPHTQQAPLQPGSIYVRFNHSKHKALHSAWVWPPKLISHLSSSQHRKHGTVWSSLPPLPYKE